MKFEELRKVIRQARIDRSMSQLDMARKSRRQRSHVNEFETGVRGLRARIDTVEAIAEVVGYRIEYDLVPIEDEEE